MVNLERVQTDACDWVGNTYTKALVWWMPKAAIIVALFAPVPVRGVVWIYALIWMGAACVLNAHRTGRMHCRYTGPFYLAMIVPVVLFVTNVISANFYGWLTLAAFIFLGSWIILWGTERAWGKFS